jgi:Zn-dependent protease/CBS domain-containing protein
MASDVDNRLRKYLQSIQRLEVQRRLVLEAKIKLGQIWGIPLGLHTSWFLVFGLVTWSLASGYFPAEYPELTPFAYWFLGGVTSVLFFGSVLLHELGHSILAIRNQIPVHSITLFIFGGIARISREPRTPGAEFRIAIAGPLTSLALAAAFFGLWQLDRHIPYLAAPSIWLARINFILATFNMIPGFPLDGGRVLRSVVWKFTGNYLRSTQIATSTGQLFALGFIAIGIYTVLRGNFFNGLWLVFIGWFLQNAAATSYAQANLRQMLKGVKVDQVMSTECPRIPGQLSISRLINNYVLNGGNRCFLVTEGDQLRGMLTLRDISGVQRANWEQTTTEEVMQPWEKLIRVYPEMELVEALQKMDDNNVAQLPVVRDDRLLGMLSRDQVLHYIRLRGEIGV